ncbi:MAG: GGDEF domain-containing protein [Bacilli bacterium]|nr:GGDEF domain-containing protein [Bacilli bacterium]
MIDETVRKKVIESYGIDIINDVLLAEDYHIVFCFDFNQLLDAEIHIVAGKLDDYGFNKAEGFKVKDVIPFIEYDNPVSYVIGKDRYLEYLFQLISNSEQVQEVYFPINKDGQILWVVCSFQTLKKDDDLHFVYGRVNWISQTTPDAIKYYINTYRDQLTQLYSKDALLLHLQKAQNNDHSYGLYFDIDNFKRINDIFGHKSGDKYLIQLGERFQALENSDTHIYRIGGDEFFVYMINATEHEAYRMAMQVIYDVEKLNPEGEQAEVSASIGIVPIIGSDFDSEDLLDLADKSMYHAKGKGKGHISYARDV